MQLTKSPHFLEEEFDKKNQLEEINIDGDDVFYEESVIEKYSTPKNEENGHFSSEHEINSISFEKQNKPVITGTDDVNMNKRKDSF